LPHEITRVEQIRLSLYTMLAPTHSILSPLPPEFANLGRMASVHSIDSQRELSPRTRDILATIRELDLRRDVEALVGAALDALTSLGRIHLPQDELEDPSGERDVRSKQQYVELAPYVLAALASVNQLTDFVAASFTPPADATAEPTADDFDLQFDLVDGPTGEGAGLTSSTTAARPELTPREQVADVASALSGMLRSRVASLAPRLRHALSQTDSWPLLSELDSHKRALLKGVQGLLFGVLGVFADGARREEILPEYRSAVHESVDLRAAITDLSYHIGRFNTAMSGAQPAELVALVVGVADRLSRFAARPEYRTLRAEDKKAVIDFRRSLHQLRHNKNGVPVVHLRQSVEGFSKFLDAMHSINHREVLVLHDRQRLGEAADKLAEALLQTRTDPASARGQLQGIVRLLSSVIGRHPELDQALRTFGAGALNPDLENEVARWQKLVTTAVGVVG